VFGDVMIYLTELADKLGIDPVEAAKSKVAINGIQDGAYPSIGATRCLETGAHYGESRAGTRCFGGRSYGILHLDFREHSFRNCPKSLERTCGVALQAAEIPPFRLIAPSAYRPNSCLKRYSKYFSDGFRRCVLGSSSQQATPKQQQKPLLWGDALSTQDLLRWWRYITRRGWL
jgi:hypothetical protein